MRLGHLTESGNCQYVQVTEGSSDDPKPRNWHRGEHEVSWGKSPGEKTRTMLRMANTEEQASMLSFELALNHR